MSRHFIKARPEIAIVPGLGNLQTGRRRIVAVPQRFSVSGPPNVFDVMLKDALVHVAAPTSTQHFMLKEWKN